MRSNLRIPKGKSFATERKAFGSFVQIFDFSFASAAATEGVAFEKKGVIAQFGRALALHASGYVFKSR